MSVDKTTSHEDELDDQEAFSQTPIQTNERDFIEELILQNKTLDALIKGLNEDIETFKTAKEGAPSAADIVRFTMQLNIMKDKKARNLAEINKIIKEDQL